LRPLFIFLFSFIISCSGVETQSYEILSQDDSELINLRLSIDVDHKSNEEVNLTVQIFPKADLEIKNYLLVFDMKFREDYNDDFTGVCIGPSWENYGSGEFTMKLENKSNFKNTITGKYIQDEGDLCSNYFYYLRFLEINTKYGDHYLIGVATDYAQAYPDAPYYWKVNKNNQIDEQGTTNIEKYSLSFELKK
tara:strand:- start:610 stop:1188 length:579 start_codon:yes stop_codon:yes gene_type:complete